jgi:hypothetical protein
MWQAECQSQFYGLFGNATFAFHVRPLFRQVRKMYRAKLQKMYFCAGHLRLISR